MVLQKVGEALAKFIQPVAGISRSQGGGTGEDITVHPKDRPKAEPEKKPPGENPTSSSKPSGEPPPPPPPPSVAQAFIQLVDLFNRGKELLSHWNGISSYQMARVKQKKAGKVKKGIMLDQRVE